MPMRKLGDALRTAIPKLFTAAGRLPEAWLTRFWTATASRSGSVPNLNVTVSAYAPSDELWDCM